MRILFASLPAYGHTFPLLPLASAARDAGHEVKFATAAEAHPLLAKFGLDAVAAGLSMAQAFTDPALGGSAAAAGSAAMRDHAQRVFGEIMPRAVVADLVPVLESWRPDLVVEEWMDWGAGIAARVAGVPRVVHGLGRITQARVGEVAPGLAGVAAAYGVELPAGLAGTAVIDICPPSLQDPGFAATPQRVPLRPQAVAVPGDGPAPEFDRDRPAVYLTLGTAFGEVEALRAALAGVRDLDAQVLVAAGPRVDIAALGGVPDHVRLEAWVPQAAVLQVVDLVIHHGGAGTTLGAAAAGVPQLILPQGADQYANADMISEYGAGRQLVGDQRTPESIQRTAHQLMTDASVAAAVDALAAEIAEMPGPPAVATRLPELAAAAGS